MLGLVSSCSCDIIIGCYAAEEMAEARAQVQRCIFNCFDSVLIHWKLFLAGGIIWITSISNLKGEIS